jgi:tagaturonate reductase
MTRRILQFGTSRFLQAHVDLIVHEARARGQDIGPIAVVKTTPGGERSGRVAGFKRGEPFPVRIRGIEAGRVIDETIAVASVDRGYDAYEESPQVLRCFVDEAEIVVSNVAEIGYAVDQRDADWPEGPTPPPSFPAKLLALLRARHRENPAPLTYLPTELTSQNGRRLAEILARLAVRSGAPPEFLDWMGQSVHFAETLVDRIVSAPIEPVGAVAEPYALWAIKRDPAMRLFEHPAVRIVDDLEPFERLKLHILNLGHTVLAERWLRDGAPADETVRAALANAETARLLQAIYDEEVLPGFERMGMGEMARTYIPITLDRFRNPFLDHRLADISQNHKAKIANRIAAFLAWVRSRDPDLPAPRLSALMAEAR